MHCLKYLVAVSFTSTLFCLQVSASLEEQAFVEAWGIKAKQVFSSGVLDTLPDPKDKKLMEKIMLLGAANLLPKEREEVCLSDI